MTVLHKIRLVYLSKWSTNYIHPTVFSIHPAKSAIASRQVRTRPVTHPKGTGFREAMAWRWTLTSI